MSSRPPGGRRRAPQKNDDRGMPLLPIVVGVVLVGFVIGAALSTVGHARDGAPQAQTAATALDTPEPTPTALATPRHSTPYPAVVPTIVHTPPVLIVPTKEPTDPPTPTAAPTPSPTPTPVPPTPSPTPTLSPTPSPEPKKTAEPTAAPTPVPPTPVPTATLALVVDSEFAREAAAAVRNYLAAVQRGDEAGAYAALGGTQGSSGLVLSEQEFMDRSAHITAIHATGTSTSSTVQVNVVSPKGEYFATYAVERGPKGPIIRNHDYTKIH